MQIIIFYTRDLEKERTDDEFMAMYEQYEAFDELEEVYLEMEEQVTALIASYVDEHYLYPPLYHSYTLQQ